MRVRPRSSSSTPRLNISSESGPICSSRAAIHALGFALVALLVQQTAPVDPGGNVLGVRARRACSYALQRGRRCRCPSRSSAFSNQSSASCGCGSFAGAASLRSTTRNTPFSTAHVEPEHVLPVVHLKLTVAVAHDHAIADRADAQAGQRHAFRQMLAQVFERAANAPARDLRLNERARGAQHDEVLEGETIFAARAARRLHEADMRSARGWCCGTAAGLVSTSRTLYDCILDAPAIALPPARLARSLRRLLDALRRLAWSELGGDVRADSVFSRLARSASIRSMTLPPAFRLRLGDRDLLAFHFLLDLGLDAARSSSV